MAIPHGFIQDILARADIVDVVGRYVTLKKTGANFKGCCPFHNEKTPSFIVSPVRQTYHCFGCGVHGDALRFLMEHNGLGFVEAVKDLAQQLGLKVPEEDVSPREKALAEQRKAKQTQLTDLLARAAHYWQAALKKDRRASDYVQRRGLSQEVVNRFGLGYAPMGWQGLSEVFSNYDDPALVEGGLVIVHEAGGVPGQEEGRRYDRFRDRIMFPIRNVKGEVIGFGGRVLDKGEPKYLNSPETPVFLKGHELYGLFEARSDIRQYGYLLVTEGYMDVVALAQHGFSNAVATLGTACTPDHLQKIFKFTDSVVFSFDGDAAGRKAARRALEAALLHAKDTRSIKFLFLPQEHDPDSFIREHGHDAFAQYVAQAMPLSGFLLETMQEGCDLTTPEGRARMLAQALPLWSQLPADGALKLQLLAQIAQVAQMSVENLQGLWARQAEEAPRPGPANGMPDDARWGDSAPYAGNTPAFRSATGHAPAKTRQPWRPYKANDSRREPAMPRLARAPLTPVEHGIRILLVHSQWWEHVSTADQESLCSQPGWHGAFFSWLERIVMDRGPVSWAVLSEAARTEPWYDMMMSLMDGVVAGIEMQPEELQLCLAKMRSASQREESARILQQFKTGRRP